jgi:UPF0176 protein
MAKNPKSYPKHLCNQLGREQLIKKLEQENFTRTTVSLYRYSIIEDVPTFRTELYQKLESLGVLGRVYVAREGINAQVCVPTHNLEAFKVVMDGYFPGIPYKMAVTEEGHSFLKLIVKEKVKILADGQEDDSYDVTDVGNHLSAKEWNEAMEKDGTIVIDVRNHYEHEIGHFENALLPDVDTFKEELPVIKDMLEGKEDQKILLYCTGGIRCEKTSAWLKDKGFKDVNQLHGGIIDYKRQVDQDGLENKFIGKNFVFDGRMGESISGDVIAHCHTCGEKADTHINCEWQVCHVLFIQCKNCQEKYEKCCSEECQKHLHLPEEIQKELKKKAKPSGKTFMKGRFREQRLVANTMSAGADKQAGEARI